MKISRLKRTIVHLRTWTKFTIIIILAAFLMVGAITYIYKPTYSVTLNGEFIGYSENKSKLQERINNYIEKGTGENVAFVEIEELPEYKLCFLKRNVSYNDEEIYNKVISQGQTYYKYYAICVSDEEKEYVSTFEEAETVVSTLKEKNSTNKDKLSIVEKYETKLAEFTDVEKCVSDLYVKKVVKQVRTASYAGTPIKAVASGTVTVAQYGYSGGYGNYVMISHGNGVQTLYGHCNSLNVKAGQSVSQGQVIAFVGNTGNSYGNHLHLEIRVNGVAQNPQNYLY